VEREPSVIVWHEHAVERDGMEVRIQSHVGRATLHDGGGQLRPVQRACSRLLGSDSSGCILVLASSRASASGMLPPNPAEQVNPAVSDWMQRHNVWA
jgi:hypothetical protein